MLLTALEDDAVGIGPEISQYFRYVFHHGGRTTNIKRLIKIIHSRFQPSLVDSTRFEILMIFVRECADDAVSQTSEQFALQEHVLCGSVAKEQPIADKLLVLFQLPKDRDKGGDACAACDKDPRTAILNRAPRIAKDHPIADLHIAAKMLGHSMVIRVRFGRVRLDDEFESWIARQTRHREGAFLISPSFLVNRKIHRLPRAKVKVIGLFDDIEVNLLGELLAMKDSAAMLAVRFPVGGAGLRFGLSFCNDEDSPCLGRKK